MIVSCTFVAFYPFQLSAFQNKSFDCVYGVHAPYVQNREENASVKDVRPGSHGPCDSYVNVETVKRDFTNFGK